MKTKILSLLAILGSLGGLFHQPIMNTADQLVGGMELWKFVSSQVQPVVSTWDVKFGNNASVSTNFEVSNTASISKFSLTDSSTGVTMLDCDGDTQALGWDLTNLRFFCGDDDTGGGGGGSGVEVRENSAIGTVFQDTAVASLSFNDGAFNVTASGTADVVIKLDWTNGPASLSEADTITGNWVNTANPWADNEVIDTLTVTGGIIGANNISGTQTTTATLTIGDNGDSIIFDASNWDISTLGKADFLSASVSTNFEAVGYASASKYFGTALTGCSSAGSQLLWTAATGLFSCETLADADIPDTITASNYLPLAGGTLTGGLFGTSASFSTGLEITGTGFASISNAGSFVSIF